MSRTPAAPLAERIGVKILRMFGYRQVDIAYAFGRTESAISKWCRLPLRMTNYDLRRKRAAENDPTTLSKVREYEAAWRAAPKRTAKSTADERNFARILFAFGFPILRISKVMGRRNAIIYCWLYPECKEGKRVESRLRYQRLPSPTEAARARLRMRRYAREEAVARGVSPTMMYVEYGCV